MNVTARHLVGRDEELGALVRLLDAPGQLPGTAVLAGEAGIGKTALLLASVQAARERDYRVLLTRPAEAEAGLSYVGLGDLLGDAGDALEALPAPQRRALAAALLLADSDERPVEERAVAVACLGALRALAQAGPLLVVVDDLQWLDGPTLAALRFSLGRLDGEPVAALLAVRGRVPRWLRATVPEERLHVLEVERLSVGALHELLRSRLDAELSRPTLIRLWETSGGNPFFALELGRALQLQGGRLGPDGELPIPADLDELVSDRLAGLSEQARAVALAVSALSDPTLELLGRLVEGSEAGLDDAVAAGVLQTEDDRVRFAHPLFASVLLARAGPGERRALHASCAAVVAGTEARARHLALAAAGPDPVAAAALDEAARLALARGAPTAAADLAEQALRLTAEGSPEATGRMVAAADAAFVAGDTARAIALLEDALARAEAGRPRAEVLFKLGRCRVESAGPREGVPLLREALRDAADAPDLEAEIHLELANSRRFTDGWPAAGPDADAAVQAADRAGDSALLARALSYSAGVRFKLGRGIDREAIARARALQVSPGTSTGEARSVLVDMLFWSNDLDGARTVGLELAADLRARDDPEESEPRWYLALIEWRAGNWALAAEHAEVTRSLHQQSGRSGLWPVAAWPGAVVAAHRGLVEEAAEVARNVLADPEIASIPAPVAAHRWVLGFLALSQGDVQAALPNLRLADDLHRKTGIDEPGQPWQLPDLLDALVGAGELDEAEERIGSWEERAVALDRPWALAIVARTRALAAAARGDHETALAGFDRALGEHARSQDPFQHARTLMAQGTTLRRAKQRAAARATLGESLARFERLGAVLWAERARAELARVGGRTSGGDELTPSERRVAELVAAGRTNREAAAELFVTVHTVEAALTRTYRKLGIRSRSELATRLDGGKQ